jgi:hypothetical protein
MSTSYIPEQGEAHTQFIQDLNQLHQKYCDQQGLVYLKYQTSLYITELSN